MGSEMTHYPIQMDSSEHVERGPGLAQITFSHQKVTISHQIARTNFTTFSHQILLRFRTNFTTFSHQIFILAYHVFAPILLRFRTKYNLFIHYFGLG